MFKRIYVLIIVAIINLGIITTTPVDVWAWRLNVDLSSSSFGSDSVCASVEGFYGFGPVRQCTNPGPNADVSFNVPDDETNYEVCTWGGLVSAILSNCHKYNNPDLSDQTVTGQFVGG